MQRYNIGTAIITLVREEHKRTNAKFTLKTHREVEVNVSSALSEKSRSASFKLCKGQKQHLCVCSDNVDNIHEECESRMVIFTISGVQMAPEVLPLETQDDVSRPSLSLLLPTNIKHNN